MAILCGHTVILSGPQPKYRDRPEIKKPPPEGAALMAEAHGFSAARYKARHARSGRHREQLAGAGVDRPDHTPRFPDHATKNFNRISLYVMTSLSAQQYPCFHFSDRNTA
jgi:hypothetical protein